MTWNDCLSSYKKKIGSIEWMFRTCQWCVIFECWTLLRLRFISIDDKCPFDRHKLTHFKSLQPCYTCLFLPICPLISVTCSNKLFTKLLSRCIRNDIYFFEHIQADSLHIRQYLKHVPNIRNEYYFEWKNTKIGWHIENFFRKSNLYLILWSQSIAWFRFWCKAHD